MDTQNHDIAVVQNLIDRHFSIWNEDSAEARLAMYADVYTAGIFLADYAGASVGHDGMARKVAEVRGANPGFIFHPAPATWNHGVGRVTWGYGPAGDPHLVRGEDIFTIEDGKLASLRVFLDQH